VAAAHLGAICKLVGGKVDFAKRTLPNQAAQGIVPDRLEVLICELAVEGRSAQCVRGVNRGSYSSSSWYE
jgi:hypothetical protein